MRVNASLSGGSPVERLAGTSKRDLLQAIAAMLPRPLRFLAVGGLGLIADVAIIVGAAVGALISYNGHRLFAFAPVGAERAPSSTIDCPQEIVIQ
jgi:hypothetical protein